MPSVQHPRGTAASLAALAAANGLLPGQIYLITDQGRLAVALTASTYETFAKLSEAGGEFGDGTGNAAIDIDGGDGFVKSVFFRTGGLARWRLYSKSNAESGGNAGSDMTLWAFNDAGIGLGSVFTVNRATQVMDFALPPTVGGDPLTGAPLGNWDFWEESWLGQASAAAQDGFLGSAVASGTNNTALPAAALLGYNPYGVFLRSSTTANGGYRYSTTSAIGQFFGSAPVKFRSRFLWRTAFTGRTVRAGFLDTLTSTDAVDGAYFEILDNVCYAKTASNSTRTTNATTVTLSLDTPYSFEIDVAASGASARFRVFEGLNETPILDVTNTTNIPTTSARVFGASFVATESSVTASDIGILYSMGMGTIPGFKRATGRT